MGFGAVLYRTVYLSFDSMLCTFNLVVTRNIFPADGYLTLEGKQNGQ